MDINEWAAEKCGVTFKPSWKGKIWYFKDVPYEDYPWTIKDPRCLVIVVNSLIKEKSRNLLLTAEKPPEQTMLEFVEESYEIENKDK